jgi:UDP-N-acetylglucosamine 2-epimerase (non-hydrolysing)
MPEEINRIVTDSLTSLFFTTSRDADENLKREGVDGSRIHFVGNVMIDTLCRHLEKARKIRIDKPDRYALVTLHRPSNVDDPAVLRPILEALEEISRSVPVLFPVHPRTAKCVNDIGVSSDGIRMMDPLGYLEFLNLESSATIVLTDSGGVQEETTILGVPCLTLRRNTERPITITNGTNTLVGPDKSRILAATGRILAGDWENSGPPESWDGHTAGRIVAVLRRQARNETT